jgi:hypothetical protein
MSRYWGMVLLSPYSVGAAMILIGFFVIMALFFIWALLFHPKEFKAWWNAKPRRRRYRRRR